jgi:hypothetical protein
MLEQIESKPKRKNVVQNPYNMRHIYNDYLGTIDINSPYYVTADEFYRICENYFKAVCRAVIYESKTYVLPFRLGHFTVMKKKPKLYTDHNLSIDWAESKKYGKWIRHLNDHTGGFKFRFIWTKKSCMVVNKEYYRLVMSRSNKRLLAKVIKSGEVDYLERL